MVADDFLEFLHALCLQTDDAGFFFGKDKFEEDMVTFLGEVSMDEKPTRTVSSIHIELLKTLQKRLPIQFKRVLSAWILPLEHHLINSCGKCVH